MSSDLCRNSLCRSMTGPSTLARKSRRTAKRRHASSHASAPSAARSGDAIKRLLLDDCEFLLEALDLTFRLASVLRNRGLELFALGGFCHFRQGRENFLLRKVDLLQRVMKELIELLRFLRHVGL